MALALKESSEFKINNVYYFDLKFSFLACTCTHIFPFRDGLAFCRIVDFKNQYFKRNNLINTFAKTVSLGKNLGRRFCSFTPRVNAEIVWCG